MSLSTRALELHARMTAARLRARALKSVSVASVSGVSVMRIRSNISGARPAAPSQVERVEARPEQPAESLPLNLKVALMSIAAPDTAGRQLWHKLRELPSIPKPTLDDYRQLAALGLAILKPGERFHSIFGNGQYVADACARSLAKSAGLHAFYSGGNGRYHSCVKCVCGWSRSYPLTNSRMSRGRLAAEASHNANLDANRHNVIQFFAALKPPNVRGAQ